jgi:hypothetical protein
MARIAITRLDGGLNQGRAASDLDPNEFTNLKNWYIHAGKLHRRGGMRRLTTDPWEERITGIVSFRNTDDASRGLTRMVVAGTTRFGSLAGNVVTTLPFATPATSREGFTSSLRRWCLFQFKDVCYGLREGAGLVRSDGRTVDFAGGRILHHGF